MNDDDQTDGCERWREAISAAADGEPTGLDPRLVEAHVARCPSCRSFRGIVAGLNVGPAPVRAVSDAEPELARTVVQRVAAADRARRPVWTRVALALTAATVLVLTIPELILGHDGDATGHGARHLGAFGVAYAVALATVVWRPARARTILPVSIVLSGALLITAAIDIVEGHVPLAGEAVHLPELVSVFLVWRSAVPTPGRTGPLRHRIRRAIGHGDDGRSPVLRDADRPAV